VAKSVNRPILPVLRRRELIIPGRHGTYSFNDEVFDKRIIEVQLKYIGTSFAELRTRARQIAYWLSGFSGTKNLIFNDEIDKYYVGKIYNEIGLQNLFRVGECTVQFECKPFAYATLYEYDETLLYDDGETYDSGLIYPNQRSYGTYFLAPFFSINAKDWCGFQWAYSPHMTSLYNHATIETPFTINIFGAVENPQVVQEGTTATFTISASLTAGSTMIIDSDNMTVTLNGTNYLHKMTGSFINLEVGANGFFFYGTNPAAEVTFSWVHQWL
jgi:predicted phage tail component-like protein